MEVILAVVTGVSTGFSGRGGYRKSAFPDCSVRPPYFIKNPVAVRGRLGRLRGFSVALKILAQSGTVFDI
jgi:hypothetical protein